VFEIQEDDSDKTANGHPEETANDHPDETANDHPDETDNGHPVIDLTTLDSNESLQSHPRASCLSSSLTRQQFGDIDIPSLMRSAITKKDIKGIFGKCSGHTDPFELTHRPPESAVRWAEEVVRKIRRGKRATAVQIGNLGIFTPTGIEILRKYCEVSQIKHQINEEKVWLDSDDGLTCPEIEGITKMLWDSNITATILSSGAKSIDVASFATLANERYLDNFIINFVILKYLQDQDDMQIIYLPSEAFTWLKSSDKKFIVDNIEQAIIESKVHATGNVQLMVVPVHMNGCHWGLVVVDFLNARLLFDDGMKWQPRRSPLAEVQQLLDNTQRLIPNDMNLATKFWNQNSNFERFGMPLQMTGTTQGAGSCGVGVILSARDFIQRTHLPMFNWNFNDMSRQRKNICLNIVEWSKTHHL